MNEIEKLIEQLHFGCPFKPNTIGIKDAEKAEAIMELAANTLTSSQQEVERLKDQLHYINLQPCPECKELESELDRVRGDYESIKVSYRECETERWNQKQRAEKAEAELESSQEFCRHCIDDEDGVLCKTIAMLEKAEAEMKHWKANHDCIKERLAVLQQRPDLPFDRIPVYEKLLSDNAQLKKENERLKVYADKLADSLPEGKLPKDVELQIREQARTEAVNKCVEIANQYLEEVDNSSSYNRGKINILQDVVGGITLHFGIKEG